MPHLKKRKKKRAEKGEKKKSKKKRKEDRKNFWMRKVAPLRGKRPTKGCLNLRREEEKHHKRIQESRPLQRKKGGGKIRDTVRVLRGKNGGESSPMTGGKGHLRRAV